MDHRKLEPGKIVVATYNAGKVREIKDLLAHLGMTPVSVAEFDLEEPEETEDTFVGNALIKAHAAAEGTGMVSLADDSGLMVDALDGDPGVYTANWAELPDGTRDWDMAMQKVEDALAALGPDAPRGCQFVCTLALAWPDGHYEVFEGQVRGNLVWPPRGDKGFGYDPVFQPLGHEQTFAEMDPALKHAMSHRAEAFRRLVAASL